MTRLAPPYLLQNQLRIAGKVFMAALTESNIVLDVLGLLQWLRIVPGGIFKLSLWSDSQHVLYLQYKEGHVLSRLML